MITVSLCLAAVAVAIITGIAHYLWGPRSQHPVTGVAAYISGTLPVFIAFAGVELWRTDIRPWQTIIDLAVLFVAASLFPIFGRVVADFQDLQDYRFSRSEQHAKNDSVS